MKHTARTVTIAITDAAIRRLAADDRVQEIKAAGLPLRLRFTRARQGASWHIVHHAGGKPVWRKVGDWPALTAKALTAQLPGIMARFAEDRHRRDVKLATFDTLAQVLDWHLERALSDRNLSERRKSGLKTAIRGHLLPLVQGLTLDGLTKDAFDERVIWPLQERYALATVRLDFAAAKAATKRAAILGKIERDPLAGFKFADFIETAPVPKAGRLQAGQIPEVLERTFALSAPAQMLILLMLLHGTRIGETRQAAWSEFTLTGDSPCWNIPASHTKTRQALRLPITPRAAALLESYRQTCRSAYLFPAPGGRRPISAQTAGEWVSVAGQGDWSAHDLRKLARTCWTDQGVDYMVGELLLNHALSKLDQTYIHTFAEHQKRAALTDYHEHLAELGLPEKII